MSAPRFAAAACFALVMLAAPRPSDACDCLGQDLDHALAAADVVFVGEAKDVAPARTRFSIERTFKGKPSASFVVVGRGSSCDVRFAAGERWLVFARATPAGLTTSQCTRTARASDAAEDLRVLGSR